MKDIKNKALWIVDQQKITDADLKEWRSEAIDEWHKAEKAIIKAEQRRRDAEAIIESCNARRRFLRLMSNQ